MAKILVTGHKGFIGGYLLPKLGNFDVVGLDKKNGEQENILTCDLPDADIVIHLAAEPGVVASVKDPLSNAETNIIGTVRLLKRYPNAKFIFSSSGGTIQETIESPYGLSKKTCEEYIKLLSKNEVILRFPNVYGEGSRSVVDKWLNQKPEDRIIYGNGQTYRIYAHVNDVVRAILLSLDWGPGTYKLGTNQRYTVQELVDYIGGPFQRYPAREGEITNLESQLINTTPNWKPEVELMGYIDGNK